NAVKLQQNAAITKHSTIAGPACSAAACPVMTKIPPPMTAPMPSAVMPHGPIVRFSAGPSPMSASEKSVFFASSCPIIACSASPRSHAVVGKMAAAIAVAAIQDEPDRRPHDEHDLRRHAEIDEQQQ